MAYGSSSRQLLITIALSPRLLSLLLLLARPAGQPPTSTIPPSQTNVTATILSHPTPDSTTFASLFVLVQTISYTYRRFFVCLGSSRIPDAYQYGEIPSLAAAQSWRKPLRLTYEQPSATGSSWEKYQKNYADDEIEEKKITPLSDESVPDIPASDRDDKVLTVPIGTSRCLRPMALRLTVLPSRS